MRNLLFIIAGLWSVAGVAAGLDDVKRFGAIRVAILKFEVNLDGVNQTPLARQLTDRFTKSVLELRRCDVVDDLDVARTMERLAQELKTGDPDLIAPKLGQTLGAAQVLISRVFVLGDMASVTTKLVDVATSKTINVYTADKEGGTAGIVPAMNEVVSQLSRDSKFGLTIKEESSKSATIRVPTDVPTITAAMERATSGDTILVSAGTYNELVKLKSGVRLIGSSSKEVFVRQKATALLVENCTEGEVRGMTFVGGAPYDDDDSDQNPYGRDGIATAVLLRNATVSLVGCEVQPSAPFDLDNYLTSVGVSIIGGQSIMQDVSVARFARGVSAGGRALVERCNISHNGATGLELTAPNVVAQENTCSNNGGDGIEVGSITVRIEKNVCSRNGHSGISIGSEYGDFNSDARPKIVGNICRENRHDGIFAAGANAEFRGNECHRNMGKGIHFASREGNPIFEKNRASQNSTGIQSKALEQVLIMGNTCNENEFFGISVNRGRISDNTCSENGGHGILVNLDGTVSNNRLEGNDGYGIALGGGYSSSQFKNRFSGNAGGPCLDSECEACEPDCSD